MLGEWSTEKLHPQPKFSTPHHVGHEFKQSSCPSLSSSRNDMPLCPARIFYILIHVAKLFSKIVKLICLLPRLAGSKHWSQHCGLLSLSLRYDQRKKAPELERWMPRLPTGHHWSGPQIQHGTGLPLLYSEWLWWEVRPVLIKIFHNSEM
jgi:hypothetical protein